MLKSIITFCLFFFAVTDGLAYTFGEHLYVGNSAMSLFFKQNNSFQNTIFGKYVPINFDTQSQNYIFTDLSIHQFPISYGTINGLSGDHAEDPLYLEQQLRTQNSDILKVLALHNQFLTRGFITAPARELLSVNKNFGYLALVSLCHFHAYGKGLKGNLENFDIQNIEKIITPALTKAAFNKLDGSNLINMYVTVHAAAVYLAEMAGVKANNNDVEAKKYLYYAFLYNGFADHFLEDGFSSGHLVVNRSIYTSVINNKPLHDFYCKYGTEVVNIRGEIWKEYGDGLLNHYHEAYAKTDSLVKVNYPLETASTKRMAEAINTSISELYDAFERGYQQNSKTIFITDRIPTASLDERVTFFVNNFKALRIMPLPYNTELETVMPDSLANNTEVKETNQILYYRNFVRNRIANSVIIGGNLGFTNTQNPMNTNFYVRLNVGQINDGYTLNENYGKKGTVDIWNGYTASYTFGNLIRKDNKNIILDNWTLKGGIRSNFDFWFSNKRFLGLYMYNEVGIDSRNSVNSFVYVPQIGIQLGSLFNINYYNMPAWLRIPIQFILPFSLHVGCVYSTKHTPMYFIGHEINLVF